GKLITTNSSFVAGNYEKNLPDLLFFFLEPELDTPKPLGIILFSLIYPLFKILSYTYNTFLFTDN
uniref:hypothetical protein n=1 Tax=Okeania sp. SIO2F4 TaxID=2607790 RepID=UPI0025D2F0F2